MDLVTRYFEVIDAHISTRIPVNGSKEKPVSKGIVKLQIGKKEERVVVKLSGSVNALDGALRKALEVFFPCVEGVKRVDYTSQRANGREDSEAPVKVFIVFSDKHGNWTTDGTSSDVISASFYALVEGFNEAIKRSLFPPPVE